MIASERDHSSAVFVTMLELLNKLNDEQIKPVLATEGAVLVIAGAGSGKTRVLTSRIAHLVEDMGVSPYNILAITFTNKAADEMKERLEKIIGDSWEMWVCTIHSMCVRILRSGADKIGYGKDFSIYSESDKEKVVKRVIAELGLEADKYAKPVRNLISSIKNKNQTIDEFEEENPRLRDVKEYCKIMRAYERELKRSNAFDFDDLLIKTLQLLSEDRETLNKYADRFKYVHIDEFQDTNAVQYEIVKMLSLKHGNIFAVGDDDQSIYGWRGADINNILGFEHDFKNAQVFKLERNYRSTKKILDIANAVIAHNVKRKQKTLWTDNADGVNAETYIAEDESGEAQYTAIQIKNLVSRGYKYSDFAVLMRINALSRSYEQEFMKYGIPCKVYGGFKFFERKEIKDLSAYLRILANPLDNEAILRVINVPKRGIGDRTIEILDEYATKNGFSVFDSVFDYDKLDLTAGAKVKIKSFKDIISSLIVDKETMGLTELVRSVIDRTDYMSCFAEQTDENEDKKRNIDEFLASVDEFVKQNPEASLTEYLNGVTLSSDTDEINDGEFVTLATVHSVKGLEYRCVFVCGMDKDVFPISRADSVNNETEEERRLMYVAVTRARERLFITRAKSRYLYGSRRPTAQSEFLDEISDKLGLKKEQDYYRRNEYSSRSSYGGSYGGGYSRGGSRSDYGSKGGYGSSGGGDDFSPSQSYGSYKKGYANAYLKQRAQAAATPKTTVTGSGDEFATGAKVRHKKFGDGIIVGRKKSGDDVVVDVAFKGIGVKSLVVRFAPLEVIK